MVSFFIKWEQLDLDLVVHIRNFSNSGDWVLNFKFKGNIVTSPSLKKEDKRKFLIYG